MNSVYTYKCAIPNLIRQYRHRSMYSDVSRLKSSQILQRYLLLNDASNILVSRYIHERDNWTAFRWNSTELTALLEKVNRKQGLLYDRWKIQCKMSLKTKWFYPLTTLESQQSHKILLDISPFNDKFRCSMPVNRIMYLVPNFLEKLLWHGSPWRRRWVLCIPMRICRLQ